MNEPDTELLFDQALLEERQYWTQRLSVGIEDSSPKLDRSRPIVYAPVWKTVEVALTGKSLERMKKLTGNSPLLVYATLMSGLMVCLRRYTGSTRIAVGSPALGSKEGKAAGNGAAGNVLTIVDDVQDQISFQELLVRVHRTLRQAYERQAYPYKRLLKDLGLHDIGNKCPLFDVALVLTDIHSEMPDVKNDITLTFTGRATELVGRLRYDERLFDKEGVERFAGHFINVLASGINKPKTSVGDLEMLGREEREFLLFGLNATTTDYARHNCVHELFELQADRLRNNQTLLRLSREA
jgi:non-ribosomal peptide synthetase component F